MKFSIPTSVLVSALELVIRAAAQRLTVPSLSCVLIETVGGKLRFSANDGEAGLRVETDATIESDGSILVPAKRLYEIARNLPGADVAVEEASSKIATITSGPSRFKIYGLDPDDFQALNLPVAGSSLSFKVGVSSLRTALREVLSSVSSDTTRHILNGVLFNIETDGVSLVATDGRRLAVSKLVGVSVDGGPTKSFVLPTKGAGELLSVLEGEGDVFVLVNDNHASFQVSNVLLSSKLLDGTFPNYRQVIPSQYHNIATFDRNALLSVVRRISLIGDKSTSIRFNFKEGALSIESNLAEVGEGSETLAVEYTGKPISIGFNPSFITDTLKALSDQSLVFRLGVDGTAPGVIAPKDGDRFLSVIMPMRVLA